MNLIKLILYKNLGVNTPVTVKKGLNTSRVYLKSMKFNFIIVLLLLLSIAHADFAEYDLKQTSCLNTTHLLTNYTNAGVAVGTEETPCDNGCNLNSNSCYNIEKDNNFLFLLGFVVTVIVFASLTIFWLVSEDYSWIKFLLLSIAFFFQYFLINSVASLAEQYTGSIHTLATGFMQLATAYTYVVLFIIAMLLFKMIIDMIARVNGDNSGENGIN